MKHLPDCLLYSSDPDLVRRVSAYASGLVRFHVATDACEVRVGLSQWPTALLVVDLMCSESETIMRDVLEDCPGVLVIALGTARSEPALAAEAAGAFSVEARDVVRPRLQSILRQADQCLRLMEENRFLRDTSGLEDSAMVSSSAPHRRDGDELPLSFLKAFRHFADVDAFLDSIVRDLGQVARVSRVGVVCLNRRSQNYAFRAGVKCLAATRELSVADSHPFARWLAIHAHVVNRRGLARIDDADSRLMLTRMLDDLGAELIVPLHGREELLGWCFVGHHVTGEPFETADIERLVSLVDHVALLLDNAMLHDEVAMQKTLAETVLHSIPVGIVAADAGGVTRWFNGAAEEMLAMPASDVVGQGVIRLGSRLAHVLSANEEVLNKPMTWEDRLSGKTLSATGRVLRSDGREFGRVAILHDLTQEQLLREQQDQVDRASFWTELAAAMSHEVRNPLVAISTFAQLLPERYGDEEFRQKFSGLVADEIGRLNAMIDQINQFANPPKLQFSVARIDMVLSKAVQAAVKQVDAPKVNIERLIEPGLPMLWADEIALAECFAHVLMNAIEALSETKEPAIVIRVGRSGVSDSGVRVVVSIEDNGRGIPKDDLQRLFSPFFTTKARGIGLGLPIAKRTLTDHNGEIRVESGTHGTTVTALLPVPVTEKAEYETSTCS
ncbi:MAG: PAS domain-containing protein [Kiritimatiellae bacterium]|nr:PAS domain-containing protein [Kiritimatiellia bacterium]